MSSDDRRELPPDPAGTQPKVDPASLVPSQQNLLGPPSPPTSTADAAEAAVAGERLPERVVHGGAPAVAEPRPAAPRARRFHALIAAMLAVGVIAIAAVVVLVATGDGGHEEPQTWSSWKPRTSSLEGASAEIARHVGPQYRAESDQLALVSGGPPSIEAAGFNGGPLPLRLILHEAGQRYTQVDGSSALYRLCGLGQDCALAGEPSEDRLLLVRREALELALYSFHYIKGLDHVIVTMPPLVSETDEQAAAPQLLYFRRRDLGRQLRPPLAETLPGKTPLPETVKRSPGVKTVQQTTASRLFSYSVQPSNTDNNAFLIVEET